MKPEPNLRKWLLWLVVVGFAAGLMTALVGVKVPTPVLTLCAVLPILVVFVMRRSLKGWR